jgi:hypothetical protein
LVNPIRCSKTSQCLLSTCQMLLALSLGPHKYFQSSQLSPNPFFAPQRPQLSPAECSPHQTTESVGSLRLTP